MESESSTRKRARIDSTTDAPSIARSNELWFEDGSIVIEAESTQFRVHRAVLAKHSRILADCLGIPQPEGEPVIEGCPVLRLSDSAIDVGHVFGLLYDASTIDLDKPITFSLLSAMVRLGRKYEFTYFLQHAVKRLRLQFPQTTHQSWVFKYFVAYEGFLFDIANLCVEFSIQSVLPAVFTVLYGTHTMEAILDGVSHEGGTSRLQPQVMRMALVGRVKYAQLRLHFADELSEGMDEVIEDSGCRARSCLMVVVYLLQSHLHQGRYPHEYPIADSPGDCMNEVTSGSEEELERLCAHCRKVMTTVWTQCRQDCWAKVPRCFGFESWASLKDDCVEI